MRACGWRRLALAVLAAANVGLLAVVSSGHTVLADVAAPLTGHLIGFGLAASLALVVPRLRLALLVGGVTATIALHAWLGLAPCCGPLPAPQAGLAQVAASGESRLTVLAFNTWEAQSDTAPLAHYLAAAPADVVILSEFTWAKRPLLAALKAVYPYQVGCVEETECGLVLLSRAALTASGVGRIEGDGAGTEGPHFIWGRIGTSLTIVGSHADRPGRNPWRHVAQMNGLTTFMRRIDGSVVLAGDFNTSLWSATLRRLRNATGLMPTSLMTPTWPAWPVPLPQLALDHILASPDIAVLAAGTGPALGSDHLPVWATLRLPSPERSPNQRPLVSRLAAAGAHLGGELLADLGREHVGAGHLRR